MLRRLALPAALLVVAACPPDAASRSRPPPAAEPPPEGPMLSQRGKVAVRTADGREVAVDVEIASDGHARGRGLMFRKTMPEGSGMIFVFPIEDFHPFWMKNTYLALDMIFADTAGRVVGLVENAEPLTLMERAVPARSKLVLEVNGGFAARHGIRAGDLLTLQGLYDLR